MRLLIIALLFSLLIPHNAHAVGGKATSAVKPYANPAIAAGYLTNTFSSTFSNDIDFNKTYAPGFKWYFMNYHGQVVSPSCVQIDSEGAAYFLGESHGYRGQLGTTAAKNGSFIGTAFGGGGYFEATIKFDSTNIAFWLAALEHSIPLPEVQWVGQIDGYEHYIELDILERFVTSDPPYYIGTIHDWYGKWAVTCPTYCVVNNIPGGNNRNEPVSYLPHTFTDYHKYGVLWVPATATTKGYVQYYFDRRPIGKYITWEQFTTQSPIPSSPWTYGVIDQQHLTIFLGSDPGYHMTVKDVNVWQKDATGNMTN